MHFSLYAAKAMLYLHRRNIIHRNLKSDAIMVLLLNFILEYTNERERERKKK
jgi:serine/threonine protein kinase